MEKSQKSGVRENSRVNFFHKHSTDRAIASTCNCYVVFQLFKRLKYEVPKYYHKVSGVAGDCSLPGLGLSVSSRNTLINEVNIVFHGAATVRFDEHIRVAMTINVSGTRELLNLAKKIINLKVRTICIEIIFS